MKELNIKKSDIVTGRIIQRVIDAKKENSSKVVIVHGVGNDCDIHRIEDNLFEFFINCTISWKRLQFGYELKIEVE